MPQTSQQKEKIEVDKKQMEHLKEKASVLDDLLSLIEDKYLGDLMKKTEEEEDIPLSEAEKVLRKE